MSKVIIGTELVLNVDVPEVGADKFTMKDYDFDITLACGTFNKKTLVFEKRNKPTENNYSCSVGLKKSEDNNGYNVAFNTADLGVGKMNIQVKAFIPDGSFDFKENDRKRTEIIELENVLEIVKSII